VHALDHAVDGHDQGFPAGKPDDTGVVTQPEELKFISEAPPNRLDHLVLTGEMRETPRLGGCHGIMPSIEPHQNRSETRS
jgi:hypothetical protein